MATKDHERQERERGSGTGGVFFESSSLHSKTDYNRRKAKSAKQTHGNEAESNESSSSQISTRNVLSSDFFIEEGCN